MKKATTRVPSFFFFLLSFFFSYQLSSAPIRVPFKGKATCFYGFGPLKKVKKSIWLFTKVFVWIHQNSMGRKRKLKKACCDWEVQKQNVVTPKLAIKEQNLTTS